MMIFRKLAALGLLVGACVAVGGCGRSGDSKVSAGGSANTFSADRRLDVEHEPSPLAQCDETDLVNSDGDPLDWTKVAKTFDQSGPFSAPKKPSWQSLDTYCDLALAAVQATPVLGLTDAGSADREADNGVNGPNRFVYGPLPGETGEPKAVLVNRMELMIYPASVHDAFYPAGNLAGYFARGVEFAPITEFADAQAVADDERFKTAIEKLVDGCDHGSRDCDELVRSVLAAGSEGLVGRPVQP